MSSRWSPNAALMASTFISGLVGTTTALAQEPGARASTGLEEVVVTATKRETRVQDTPAAIVALSAQRIENQRIQELQDVEQSTPGVTFVSYTKGTSWISIRGSSIGNDDPGADQGANLFIDEVVTTGVIDLRPELFDVERIEILKGPQGTLFGRNVTGGIVSVHTREPSFDPEMKLQATYGSHELLEGRAFLSGPLIEDALAGKLVISRVQHGDYIDNERGFPDAGEDRTTTVRGQVLFTPKESVRVGVAADYMKNTGDGRPLPLLGTYQPELFAPLTFDPDSTNQAFNGHMDREIAALTARIEMTSPLGEWTLVSGYRDVQADMTHSTAGNPVNVVWSDELSEDRQFTQEVRLASPEDQRLSWIMGAYYLSSDKSRDETFHFAPLPGQFLSLFPAGLIPNHQDVEVSSYAAFGAATLRLTDRWSATAGLRYTLEEKDGFSFKTRSAALFGGPIEASYSEDWDALTPKLTLSYKPSTDFMGYVTAERGFKSGGFDTSATTAAGLATPFDPEFVWNYEIGVKSEWLENRLRLNATVFQMDFTDLQVRQFVPANATFQTANAADARTKGVELEIEGVVTDWLHVGANYAYQDAKYRQYVIDNADPAPDVDNSGNRIPNSPRHSGTVFLQSEFPVAVGDVTVSANFSFRSNEYFDDANTTPEFIRDKSSYRLIDLQAAWSSPGERVTVSLWGKNLTDERYLTIAYDGTTFYRSLAEAVANDPGQIFLASYNQGRTIGLTVTLNLD